MARKKSGKQSIALSIAIALIVGIAQAVARDGKHGNRVPDRSEHAHHAPKVTRVPSAPSQHPRAASPAPSPTPDPSTDAPPPSAAANPSARLLDEHSAWFSPAACEAALLAAPHGTRQHAPGVVSWNLAWFPDGAANGISASRSHDVAWQACVMTLLDVQVFALQEVVQNPRGRAALLDLQDQLDRRNGGNWQAELDDCPDDGRQHIGFLYDAKRVTLSDAATLRELNPGRSACDKRLRPGFSARAQWKDGPELQLLTLHFDSGETARDYGHRVTSIARLKALMPTLAKHNKLPVLALGDFNTMGCDDCNPKVTGDAERQALRDLPASTDSTATLRYIAPEPSCSEYYKKHGTLLDHALWAAPSGGGQATHAPDAPHARVQGICAEVGCGTIRRQKLAALQRLSDHCPVLVEWEESR